MKLTRKQESTMNNFVQKYLMTSTGCTEPIAIAYASAVAADVLGEKPTRIEVELSPNMAKNAMDAGVPGSKHVGAGFVAAEGALYGDPKDGFELLGNVPQENQERAYSFSKHNVDVKVAESDKALYIQIVMFGEENCCCCNKVRVVVEEEHTNVVLVEYNDEVIVSREKGLGTTVKNIDYSTDFGMEEIFEYAEVHKDDQIFKDAIRVNSALSEHGMQHPYGLNVGKALPFEESTISSRIISATTSAVDARMAGAPLPAMACTGSGNQGITTTMPVVQLAKELGATDEEMVKAVIISDLTAIYIKKELKVLSHLCGAVIAGTGATAGMTYLMGGDYKAAEYAVQSMLGTVTGMFCDGAKSTCALKVCACINVGMYAADLAVKGIGRIENGVGIVNANINQTIKNVAKIEKDSGDAMDSSILDIIVR